MPAATVTPPGTRLCGACDTVKPISEMVRDRKGRNGVQPLCRACRRQQRHLAEHPNAVSTINWWIDQAPDPSTAIRLREELAAQRRAGRPWRSAWSYALHETLRHMPLVDQISWRQAFSATKDQWRDSYRREGRPIGLFAMD
jgi:hypothetical protein